MLDSRLRIPEGATISRVEYRVPFYDTDAMAIVHHANYVRYLELARVRFLQDHDQPYNVYVAQGYHVVVTRVEVALKRATRFDETLIVSCWLEGVRAASLSFGYQIHNQDQLTLTGCTGHAVVNLEGRPVRMPAERRHHMQAMLPSAARGAP